MNNFIVEIYKNGKWEEYTKKCVFPLKIAEFLDEELDEVNLFIKKVKDEYFNPLTIFRLTLKNTPSCLLSSYDVENIKARAQDKTITYEYNEDTKQLTETKQRLFVVATDNSIEKPIGSGFYEHTIYLIESTKILEGFISDSISFTNPLGNNHTGEKAKTTFNARVEAYSGAGNWVSEDKGLWESTTFNNAYILTKNSITMPTVDEIFEKEKGYYNDGLEVWDFSRSFIEVKNETGESLDFSIIDNGILINNIPSGTYTATYLFTNRTEGASTSYDEPDRKLYLTYNFSAIENHYPTKKWTITDVINRTLDLIEPLDYGEKPRFRLSGVKYDNEGNEYKYESNSLGEKLDKILAPEFSFTKMTLREQLQQIGGFIHSEPRLINIHFDEDKPWFEIGFDKYGSKEKSNIKELKKPVTISLSTDINNYATKLDSTADNLINQIDFATGVIIEPFQNGSKSLRSETSYYRMGEDNNTFISTTLPIYKVNKVVCTYIPNNDVNIDITPYIFEQVTYDNLSSYAGNYPYAKSYALYYTQGQKNIKGLFFKAPNAINTSVFSRYSIINILRSASGNNNLTLDSDSEDGENVGNYPLLRFRVEYVPLYSARIQTNKQTVIGGFSRTLSYNQSANIIESRYYGENLKGVIARMGNVQKSYTYNLTFISDVPKVGTRFDEHYYISTVSTEYLPSYIKCTLNLTKNFNRLSEYIGISSNKRMWEVSEKQSQKRESVHTEYVLITENEEVENDASWFFDIEPCDFLLKNRGNMNMLVSAMNFTTYSKRKNLLHKITLPVISSAFGNSLTFTSAFEDNYSAGKGLSRRENGDVKGNWVNSVPYGDYFGRAYYLEYQMFNSTGLYFDKNTGANPDSTPKGHIASTPIGKTKGYGKKYRKDNREIPQITFELAIVTDNEDIIIGSAITKNCPFVNTNQQNIELWVFREDINKIDGKVDFSEAMKIDDNNYTINADNIVIPAIPNGYVSWALVTERIEKEITVEDEDGDMFSQTIYKGGELIIGQNKIFSNNKTFYFRKKKTIYN